MTEPKHLSDITVEDLQQYRWCYFHDEEGRYDVFEYVIPDIHPKFDTNIIELELATFKFYDGQEFFGMYDGSASYTMWVGREWISLWYGVQQPRHEDIERTQLLLKNFKLSFPVVATASWSKKSKCFNGLRYLDVNSTEIEVSLS